MSTTLRGAALTVQQRGVAATSRLREALGLDNIKVLSVALAEVAADEVSRNPGFAHQVRMAYQELAALKPSRLAQTRRADDVELVPIVNPETLKRDPFGPLDPYYLHQLYGGRQLRAALGRYPPVSLKEACALVEQRNPGTKPKNRGRIDDVIDYIVEYVTGSK
jgi:hypothetical protein